MLVATDEGILHDGRLVLSGDARQVSSGHGRWVASVAGTTHVSPDGDRWEAVAADLDHAVTAVCDAGGGTLLVGTDQAHLFGVDPDGATTELSALRAVDTFDEWHTPWGGPPDIRSIAVTPDGAWLVNVHVGGIIRSTDRGASWEPTIDLHTDVHQVIATAGQAYAALGAGGLATSHDGGATWRIEREGLATTYCRAVAVAGDRVLVSASRGPGGADSAIYSRPVGPPATLERVPLPADLPGNVDTGCLATRDRRAAVGTADGCLFVSEDAGTTWVQEAEGLGTIHGVSW